MNYINILVTNNYCTKLSTVWTIIGYAIFLVKILVPILLIVMSMVELAKNIANPSGKEGAFKSIKNKVIAAVAVFLSIQIISIAVGFFMKESEWQDCAKCAFHPFSDGCEIVQVDQVDTTNASNMTLVTKYWGSYSLGNLAEENKEEFFDNVYKVLNSQSDFEKFMNDLSVQENMLPGLEEDTYNYICSKVGNKTAVRKGTIWYCAENPNKVSYQTYAAGVTQYKNDITGFAYYEEFRYAQRYYNERTTNIANSYFDAISKIRDYSSGSYYNKLAEYLGIDNGDLDYSYASLYCKIKYNYAKAEESSVKYYCKDNSGNTVGELGKRYGDSSNYGNGTEDKDVSYVVSHYSDYNSNKMNNNDKRTFYEHFNSVYERADLMKQLCKKTGLSESYLVEMFSGLYCSLEGGTIQKNGSTYTCNVNGAFKRRFMNSNYCYNN